MTRRTPVDAVVRRGPGWVLTLVGAALLAWAADTRAAEVPPSPLPDGTVVAPLLAGDPQWRAAQAERAAEAEAARALRAGNAEWTATLSGARRQLRGPAGGSSQEWELGLERPWRRAAQAEAAAALADRRDAQAEAGLTLARRDRERRLLEDWSAWLQVREAARLARAQEVLQAQDSAGTARRHALGDAARVDRQQADAALAQARARSAAAEGLREALRAELAARWPGLPLDAAAVLPDPPPWSPTAEPAAGRPPGISPEQSLAAADAAAWSAQSRLDAAERQPAPTWGLRVGQAGNGQERVLGLSLSLPFGGPARDATARASQARASAAQQRLDHWQREDRALTARREAEALAAWAAWRAEADAAQRLDEVAAALARGQALGETALGELLAARRLAQAQRLAASEAAVNAWRARWRAVLERDGLWPAATGAAAAPAPAATAATASAAAPSTAAPGAATAAAAAAAPTATSLDASPVAPLTAHVPAPLHP